MRGLLTLLFGAGFLLFYARGVTSSGRTDIGRLYLKRSALLILMGVFHAVILFWPGDILIIYGLVAFALIPFRRASVRTLLIAASLLLVTLSVLSVDEAVDRKAKALANSDAVIQLPGTTVIDRIDHAAWAQEIATRRSGLADNFHYFRHLFVEWLFTADTIWWALDALALMLVGAALFRLRIITGERSSRFYAGLALAAYVPGVVLNVFETGAMVHADFAATLVWPAATYQLSRLAMSLGHMALILWLLQHGTSVWLFGALARVGRMALTNYLLQSAIAAVLFSGFGLGLYGSFNRAQLWCLAGAIWIVEIAFSWWWLSHFRMGPAEQVWRTMTYGRNHAPRSRAV